MKTLIRKNTLLSVVAALGLVTTVSPLSANELGNPGFENDTTGSYGNNVSPRLSVAPWTPVGQHNVVKVDGVGGLSWYANNGPALDASGVTGFRHYLDMQDSEGSIYQQFTTPSDCSGEVRFGGFFSTRANLSGYAHLEIREGVGDLGNLVGTTAVVYLPSGSSETDPWLVNNLTANLSASTTYSFVIWMDNNLNFDEAYVNFVTGPCQDNSDILPDPDPDPDPDPIPDPAPQACLEIKHQVSCSEAGWQVDLTHATSSVLQPDQYTLVPITSGVSVSGSSPSFVLSGALPNSAVDLLVYGTQKGGGSVDGTDLCCEETRIHVDIPDQQCGPVCEENEELIYGACTLIEQSSPSEITRNSNSIPVAAKKQLVLTKSGAPRCKAGGVCHFTIGLENPTNTEFKGPVMLIDQPSKMFGRVQGASKGWQCQRAKNSYQCLNPDFKLASNAATEFALSLSVPKRLSGKVKNCIKGQAIDEKVSNIYLLQALLKDAGFDPNGIDGKLGSGTKKAMKKYAAANGLDNSGDAELLAHLQLQFPALATNTACTTVRIDRPRLECRAGSIKKGGVCIRVKVDTKRCAAGENWTGKQCVVCEEGSQWNNKRKSCVFPQVSVNCEKDEKRQGDRCVKIKKPSCIPFLTHYSARLGMCIPNISIGIGLGGGGSTSEEKEVDHP